MGAVKLELRCPKTANGVAIDPEPDWSFDSLLSELSSLELKLNAGHASSTVPIPFAKIKLRDFPTGKRVERNPRSFIMHVSDDEMGDIESDDEKVHDQSLVMGKRFTCEELYLSDDSEDESALEAQFHLMDKVGLVEGAFLELTDEYQRRVKEEIRNQISALETDLMGESEKSTSALIQVEKFRYARREMDRKLDTQYQRKIAEALDNHLTAVQRDLELRSQIEERRIRSDAAIEEVKRKEKALQEEKLLQEKAKAEAEAKRKIAEETKIAALEAERKALKEAADREAAEIFKRAASEEAQKEVSGNLNAQSKGFKSDVTKKVQSAGNILKVAESALKLEQGRLQKFKKLDEQKQALRLSSDQDFSDYEKKIGRWIRQITGTQESVRAKANELIKILNDPCCPQPISLAAFAKKIISQCEGSSVTFAFARVIVLVTSQVPHAMDILLAEFHQACIYTVPKYVSYSKSAFESKEAYYKIIGYREHNGKIESDKDYLTRLESYMKLYGALVQTEVVGVKNPHGLEEGWAWLARLLNALPANIYTAVALEAFLKMAGFGLSKKYKSQFKKMLDVIYNHFLNALKAQEDPELNVVITKIQSYIEGKKFLQEPQVWRLEGSLLSNSMVPEPDYRQSYQHQPDYRQSYQHSSNRYSYY
ncbi:hypothetical protein L1049_007227 [Liquidambar formosana]|uniref:mRNA export factor GLE1 n=1 Tax=Liquidambar formosana TaxID=63359 RepID=A0AAP0RGW2_LIQFO